MPQNHAKAIKGMSIACIAISGVLILLILAGLAFFAVFGPIIEESILDSYSYDYGYGYDWDDYYDGIFGAYGLTASFDTMHGHYVYYGGSSYAYDELAEFQLAMTTINIFLVLGLIAECIVLAASIIVLKNHNKPEKFGMAFAWSIVGAVLGFLAAGIIQAVLFIIIAVFIRSDKKLHKAGMYFVPSPAVPGAAYAIYQPVMPIAPAPGVPVVPVPPVPVQPTSDVQPLPPEDVPESIQSSQPEIAIDATQPPQPENPIVDTQFPQPEVEGESVQPMPSEPKTEIPDVARIDVQPFLAANDTHRPISIPDSEATPVIVDEGAVIRLEVSDDETSEQ